MKDGSLFVWGKNDRGQLGTGTGIGIDMVESENVPTQINIGEGKLVKDFTTGMNTMLVQDTDGGIYKTGLKLDY
jgi:alpha-tubulin suppressor-like RCC1 family protein